MWNVIRGIQAFFDGKKQYIVAAVAFLIGGFEALGYDVPAWLLLMLGSFGLYANRRAIAKTELPRFDLESMPPTEPYRGGASEPNGEKVQNR